MSFTGKSQNLHWQSTKNHQRYVIFFYSVRKCNIRKEVNGSQGSVTLNVEDLNSVKDSQLKLSKTAFDSVSVSSSTHFTIVNGGYSKNKRICRRGRHITVYCMTLLFFIGVIGRYFLFSLIFLKHFSYY